MSVSLAEKSNVSGNFLLSLYLQKLSLQKLQWHNYDRIKSSLVQIHDICQIFELLTKVIPFKMRQIDGMPTKSLRYFDMSRVLNSLAKFHT